MAEPKTRVPIAVCSSSGHPRCLPSFYTTYTITWHATGPLELDVHREERHLACRARSGFTHQTASNTGRILAMLPVLAVPAVLAVLAALAVMAALAALAVKAVQTVLAVLSGPLGEVSTAR